MEGYQIDWSAVAAFIAAAAAITSAIISATISSRHLATMKTLELLKFDNARKLELREGLTKALSTVQRTRTLKEGGADSNLIFDALNDEHSATHNIAFLLPFKDPRSNKILVALTKIRVPDDAKANAEGFSEFMSTGTSILEELTEIHRESLK